jgi:hypothetical protein
MHSDVVDEPFADLTKVQGLRGIYIASQITLSAGLNRVGPEHISTFITFDRGVEWRPLEAPMFDDEGQRIVCLRVSFHSNCLLLVFISSKKLFIFPMFTCFQAGNCSLHLSQRFSQLYPVTRSVPILTTKSAPGIIIAMGTVGASLKGHPGVFLSRDAGLTWRQVSCKHIMESSQNMYTYLPLFVDSMKKKENFNMISFP